MIQIRKKMIIHFQKSISQKCENPPNYLENKEEEEDFYNKNEEIF